MIPKLMLHGQDGQTGKRYQVTIERDMLSRGPVTLGRDHSLSQIVVDHPEVSRRHLELRWRDEGLQASDLNSTNGTYINGRQVSPMTPAHVQNGDRIRLGNLELSISGSQDDQTERAGPEPIEKRDEIVREVHIERSSNSIGQIFTVALIAAALVFAVISKPSDLELNKKIYADVLTSAKSVTVDGRDNLLSGLIKGFCKLSPHECARFVFDTMVTVQTEDNYIFKEGLVKIGNLNFKYIGAFNTWYQLKGK